MQSFISIILLITFSLNFTSNDIFSKLILIGSLLALSKSNHYISQLIGGLSTDVSNNLSLMKGFIKSY